MKKLVDKILNITIVLLLIGGLLSYQFILPARISHADDSGADSGAVQTVSGNSGSPDVQAGKTDDTNKTDSGTSDKNVVIDDSSNKTDAAKGTDATDNAGSSGESASVNGTVQTAAVTPPAESATPAAGTTGGTASTDPAENTGTQTPVVPTDNQAGTDQTSVTQLPLAGTLDANISGQTDVPVASGTDTTNATSDNNGRQSLTGGTGENNKETGTADNLSTSRQTADENTDAIAPADNQPASGVAAITTGDAAAQTGAVNEANTNITTNNGKEDVENINGSTTGDINLLDTFNNILGKAKDLNADNQDAISHIVVTNVNSAKDVENTVSAAAETGDNAVEDTQGNADITTGNAAAVASAVNLINTNITGDNWMLAVINIFGNWTGDLIVPGNGLLTNLGSGMQFGQITNVNGAVNVTNNVSATADTGNNSISGSSGANIQTGGASAGASAVNLVNTNIVKNNWFFLIINNAGNWVGKVINWGGDESQNNTYEYDLGSLGSGQQKAGGQVVDVNNYNNAANVTNKVNASASTGNNSIQNSGNASIVTGNASAWASAFNLVNTNITGNNWLFGIVNNAGTWNGNVVFAYPDLVVKLSADKSDVKPGETVNYILSYKNIGQAACDNVDLILSLPKYLLYQSGLSNPSVSGTNNYQWSTGGLKPGEEKSLTISAKLAEDTPRETTSLEADAGVRTETKEVELSNNYASNDVNVSFSSVVIKDESALSQKESGLNIERKDDTPIYFNETANHYIKVKNSGKHTLYNIVVTEKIKNPAGDTVAEYNWPIAKLKKGQAAYIQYQLMLDNSAATGAYEHAATALGYDYYGNKIKSGQASAKIELLANAPAAQNISGAVTGGGIVPAATASSENQQPEVLGAATASADAKYFSLWLLLLLLAPVAYYIRKNKTYRRENLLRFSKRMAGFLSSFF